MKQSASLLGAVAVWSVYGTAQSEPRQCEPWASFEVGIHANAVPEDKVLFELKVTKTWLRQMIVDADWPQIISRRHRIYA